MSRTRAMTAASTWVAIGAAGLALSGCGSATPGVAVQVGEEEISTSRVDQAAANFCTALNDDLKKENQTLSMSFMRQIVVDLLTRRSMALQIAEEYGVEPGAAYGSDVATREQTAAAMPEEVRADYVELASADLLQQDILEQVGRIKLEEDGVADPTVEQVTQAGNDVFDVWPDANGVEIDPRYGLENLDGALSPVNTDLSVAVSDGAKAGLNAGSDVAYARTLPATQRCG